MTLVHRYTGLPSEECIRILILEAGIGNEPLRCTLKTCPLHEVECQYEAISYVWGRPDNVTEIECDGKKLTITISLAEALRRFRLPSEQRALWADAICINQKDDYEKSSQVGKMAKIYQKARRVLCWLGQDDQGIAEVCFDLVKKADQEFAEIWQDSWTFDEIPHDLKLADDVMLEWRKIKSMLNLPWFERLW